MPLYRLSESHISRPRSAVQAAAYRSGKLLKHDGKIYDYSGREDVLHSEILLPENAPTEFYDRQTLWSSAESAEDSSTRRKTARIAHEMQISLPNELTLASWQAMLIELITERFVSLGMIADLNIHRGDRKDAEHPEGDHNDISPHNPHAHILLTTRRVDGEGFSDHKAREWDSWNDARPLLALRKEWADIQNRMFERKGLACRVSHESEQKHSRGRNPNREKDPRNRSHSRSR